MELKEVTPQAVCKLIDHTLLKPEAIESEIKKLCNEAIEFGFFACCINPCWVKLVVNELKGTGVKVCSVVGFPLGATTAKEEEAAKCVDDGADELDMVINIGWLKSGLYQEVEADIEQVVDAAQGKLVKVILETGVLTREEKIRGAQITIEAGANFVKTSTGFGYGGATIEDVKLLRKVVGPNFGVKASGGIKTWKQVIEFIQAGASRIGTSSGVQIIQQCPEYKKP
ncbi:MAG: deoxyribose-phosphate aldolase [bacterium]|nr:deoxyribose-phosphate aldolase [bacterium]